MSERETLLLELASLEAELLSLTNGARPAKRARRIAPQQQSGEADEDGGRNTLADSLCVSFFSLLVSA